MLNSLIPGFSEPLNRGMMGIYQGSHKYPTCRVHLSSVKMKAKSITLVYLVSGYLRMVVCNTVLDKESSSDFLWTLYDGFNKLDQVIKQAASIIFLIVSRNQKFIFDFSKHYQPFLRHQIRYLLMEDIVYVYLCTYAFKVLILNKISYSILFIVYYYRK